MCQAGPFAPELEFFLERFAKTSVSIDRSLTLGRRVEERLCRDHLGKLKRPPQVHVIQQRARQYLRLRAAREQRRDAVEDLRDRVWFLDQVMQREPGDRAAARAQHEIE